MSEPRIFTKWECPKCGSIDFHGEYVRREDYEKLAGYWQIAKALDAKRLAKIDVLATEIARLRAALEAAKEMDRLHFTEGAAEEWIAAVERFRALAGEAGEEK
jgi:hypothetical protein